MALILAQERYTLYQIVVPEDAIPSELYAAEELAHTLTEITGAYFPIVRPPISNDHMPRSIYIGHSKETAALGISPTPSLGMEGFRIKTCGEDLVIAGGRPRGTLYGVYTLLEDILGCRWYTPAVRHIPRRTFLSLPELDISKKPVLEYREAYYGNSYDGDWSARNRTNGHFDQLYEKHGGRVKYYKYFVHTFDHLIPVKEYFSTHPEYFSQIDGKRTDDHTQLCLTNPDVLRLTIDAVRGWIQDDPEATIFSVSQNDWYNPCQCEHCRKIDEEEGSHAGTLIRFVNQVAEAIERESPHVVIDTLAYQYTRPAPKHARPRHNVCVRLCSIECCFGQPLEESDDVASHFANKVKNGSSFQKDLTDWAKICDRIYIWDYVTNFSHYCMPFPNLDVLKPNINFLVKNSAKGIFEQGNYALGGGPDFNELRTWLLAKLLWNPDYDVTAGTAEFMNAYYGRSAPPLLHYLRTLHDRVREQGIRFGIFERHTVDYLDDATLALADGCFDQAELLADDEAILWRVRRARISIRFVHLARLVSQNIIDTALIEQFFQDVRRYGLTRISEWRDAEEDKALMLQGKLRAW